MNKDKMALRKAIIERVTKPLLGYSDGGFDDAIEAIKLHVVDEIGLIEWFANPGQIELPENDEG